MLCERLSYVDLLRIFATKMVADMKHEALFVTQETMVFWILKVFY